MISVSYKLGDETLTETHSDKEFVGVVASSIVELNVGSAYLRDNGIAADDFPDIPENYGESDEEAQMVKLREWLSRRSIDDLVAIYKLLQSNYSSTVTITVTA